MKNVSKDPAKQRKSSRKHVTSMHMLKQRSRSLIAQLKKKISGFQIPGGDCNIINFLTNSYLKFKDFFTNFYENNSN